MQGEPSIRGTRTMSGMIFMSTMMDIDGGIMMKPKIAAGMPTKNHSSDTLDGKHAMLEST